MGSWQNVIATAPMENSLRRCIVRTADEESAASRSSPWRGPEDSLVRMLPVGATKVERDNFLHESGFLVE